MEIKDRRTSGEGWKERRRRGERRGEDGTGVCGGLRGEERRARGQSTDGKTECVV